jgi:hypothetical protein
MLLSSLTPAARFARRGKKYIFTSHLFIHLDTNRATLNAGASFGRIRLGEKVFQIASHRSSDLRHSVL